MVESVLPSLLTPVGNKSLISTLLYFFLFFIRCLLLVVFSSLLSAFIRPSSVLVLAVG